MSTKQVSKDKWGNFENALFVYPVICLIVYVGSDLITEKHQSLAHYGWIAALFLSVWIIVAHILKSADDAARIRTAYNMEMLKQSQ